MPSSKNNSELSSPSRPSHCCSGGSGWLIDLNPWNGLPKKLIDACQKEILPETLLRNEMVRIVDAVMMCLQKKDMDRLAFKIVSKYPKSF